MTSKQRAYLRSLANTLEPIFQIGKSGISENLIQQLSDALDARELIISCLINIMNKLVKRITLKQELESSAQYLEERNENQQK